MRLLLFLLSLLILNACKDKQASCDVNFLEAEINGTQWDAVKMTALKIGNGAYKIVGEKEAGVPPSIFFELPDNLEEGPYDLAIIPNTWYYGATITLENQPPSFAESGTMQVTTLDTARHILKGTFEFTAAAGDIRVTKGSFCVQYERY